MVSLHPTYTLNNKARPFFPGPIKPPPSQPTVCMPASPALPTPVDAFSRELFSELDMMDFSQGGVVVGVCSGVVWLGVVMHWNVWLIWGPYLTLAPLSAKMILTWTSLT